jgi:hypothetical protein
LVEKQNDIYEKTEKEQRNEEKIDEWKESPECDKVFIQFTCA